MTKQEKIQKVYGEYYDMCNPNENGYFNMSELELFTFPDLLDLEYYPHNQKHRPKPPFRNRE